MDSTQDSTDRLLTVLQAAQRMSMTEGHVRRLIFQKRISYLKFGTGKNAPVRVAESDIEKFLEDARVEAAR